MLVANIPLQPFPTEHLQWNFDIWNHFEKSKLFRIIGVVGGGGLGLQRLTGKKKLGLVRIIENSEKPGVQEIGIILDKIFP